jgi:hypothetical protein
VKNERKNRIRVALFAYAYEVMDDPIASDSDFDSLCLKINPNVITDNPVMDRFFKEEFNPSTGMWIYKHPEWEGIARIYTSITGKPSIPIRQNVFHEAPITSATASHGFKDQAEMKIYIASLGLSVLPHSLIHKNLGILDFEFDRDVFRVTQKHTGISKSIFYRDWFCANI